LLSPCNHSDLLFPSDYVGTKGEIKVNQARRGYHVVREEGPGAGATDLNPFYMKYTPDDDGYFDGQQGYGYRSLELFIRACTEINKGKRDYKSYIGKLPTIDDTVATTAILEAGRISLDERRSVNIKRNGANWELV
jgi:D-galacturonate reductase